MYRGCEDAERPATPTLFAPPGVGPGGALRDCGLPGYGAVYPTLLPLGPCPSRPELKRNFHLQGASMMKRATFSAPLCAATLLALVAVSFGEALAQSAVITGKVTGRQGEGLGGAIVVIDEFSAAVATTTSGTYTLTVAPERTKGHTSELQSLAYLVCRLLLEKKKG